MDFYQRFTKIALGIALLGGMLWAEKSGGFFSIEAGLAKASFKQDIDATGHTHPGTNPNTPSQPTPLVGNITADNILPALYLKGGHKFMFGERGRFGVRPYVYFGYGYGSMENVYYDGEGLFSLTNLVANGSIFTGTGKTYYTHFFDYGVGADMLFNLVDSANEVFGVFAGVAIGGGTWVANGKEYKPSKGSEAYGNFQTILNVGVRGVLNERHGIELGAKFYLLDSVIFEGSGYSPLMSVENIPMMGLIFQSIDLNSTKTTMRRPFALTASYVYHF